MLTSAQGLVYRKKMLLPGGVQPLNVKTLEAGDAAIVCAEVHQGKKTASG